MTVALPEQRFPGKVLPVALPAGPGGLPVIVGGQNALPYTPEGDRPNPPAVGMEVRSGAEELPPSLEAAIGSLAGDPVALARRCVSGWGARFLFLSLDGCHPDSGGRSVADGAALVRELLTAVPAPVIVGGCGDEDMDSHLIPAVAEAAPRPVFLSYAEEKNYRLVAGAALAYGHGLVSWSPIDINMAKQINLLLADLGFPPERVVMDPLTGGLGVGLEYTCSIVERIRLAGLSGDAMLARPVLCHLGDAWKAREAVDASESTWGDVGRRGRRWEETTGLACLAAGADLLVCRHPGNVARLSDAAWR